ncbi:hypothetical protein QBC33DRAFT_60988, partial [Phialemonium atrogriseum]
VGQGKSRPIDKFARVCLSSREGAPSRAPARDSQSSAVLAMHQDHLMAVARSAGPRVLALPPAPPADLGQVLALVLVGPLAAAFLARLGVTCGAATFLALGHVAMGIYLGGWWDCLGW